MVFISGAFYFGDPSWSKYCLNVVMLKGNAYGSADLCHILGKTTHLLSSTTTYIVSDMPTRISPLLRFMAHVPIFWESSADVSSQTICCRSFKNREFADPSRCRYYYICHTIYRHHNITSTKHHSNTPSWSKHFSVDSILYWSISGSSDLCCLVGGRTTRPLPTTRDRTFNLLTRIFHVCAS